MYLVFDKILFCFFHKVGFANPTLWKKRHLHRIKFGNYLSLNTMSPHVDKLLIFNYELKIINYELKFSNQDVKRYHGYLET